MRPGLLTSLGRFVFRQIAKAKGFFPPLQALLNLLNLQLFARSFPVNQPNHVQYRVVQPAFDNDASVRESDWLSGHISR